MTKDRALLIVHNPGAYSVDDLRVAAAYLLGSFGLSDDDFDAATNAAWRTRSNNTPTRRGRLSKGE